MEVQRLRTSQLFLRFTGGSQVFRRQCNSAALAVRRQRLLIFPLQIACEFGCPHDARLHDYGLCGIWYFRNDTAECCLHWYSFVIWTAVPGCWTDVYQRLSLELALLQVPTCLPRQAVQHTSTRLLDSAVRLCCGTIGGSRHASHDFLALFSPSMHDATESLSPPRETAWQFIICTDCLALEFLENSLRRR